MFAATILLRRLFSAQPSALELDFHWWFVTCGIKDWQRFLASRGFGHVRRAEIIRVQERTSRRVLEVWDTQKFRTWGHRAPEPEIIGDDVITPGFYLSTHARPTAIPGGGRPHSPQLFR